MSDHEKIANLSDALRRLTIALETMGGHVPLAIDVDRETWNMLRGLRPEFAYTHHDGLGNHKVNCVGIEFRLGPA